MNDTIEARDELASCIRENVKAASGFFHTVNAIENLIRAVVAEEPKRSRPSVGWFVENVVQAILWWTLWALATKLTGVSL